MLKKVLAILNGIIVLISILVLVAIIGAIPRTIERYSIEPEDLILLVFWGCITIFVFSVTFYNFISFLKSTRASPFFEKFIIPANSILFVLFIIMALIAFLSPMRLDGLWLGILAVVFYIISALIKKVMKKDKNSKVIQGPIDYDS